MTAKPEPNFSTLAAKLTKLKKESLQRSQRILKILRNALTEAIAEIRDSRVVFSTLVKEVTAETAATVKGKSQQVANSFHQSWPQKINYKALIENAAISTANYIHLTKVKLLPEIEKLRQRYSHRYENIKEQFEFVRSWYVVPESRAAKARNDHSSDSTVIIDVKGEVIH